MAHLATSPPVQHRCVVLDPAPDRDVVNGEVPLGHDLLQIAVGEGVSQVPSNAQQDNRIFEMPAAEQCWSSSGHDTRYQISSVRVCNRTVCRPYLRRIFPTMLGRERCSGRICRNEGDLGV